jgi:hypothetical protein
VVRTEALIDYGLGFGFGVRTLRLGFGCWDLRIWVWGLPFRVQEFRLKGV